MLTTADPVLAEEIAQLLEGENTRRRSVQDEIAVEARRLALVEIGADRKALVLAGKGWHPGVIGIVAARLVDEFSRPVVMLALNGEGAHGSARSIGPFHMFAALHECRELLTTYGGHAKAAGLRLPCDRVERFREAFLAVAESKLSATDLVPELAIDAQVPLEAVTLPLLREVEMLEPFGERNAKPLFTTEGLELIGDARRMGATGKHLSFWVRQGSCSRRAVGFSMGDRLEEVAGGGRCSLAYRPGVNDFRGQESLELYVEDLCVEGK